MDKQDRDRLVAGLAQLQVGAGPAQIEALLRFLALVRKWNGAYNLVARGDLQDLVTRHLLDSVSIQPFIRGGDLLDVGSGAGFPALPLAVLDPRLHATLLDSTGKKARFLRHAARELGLENVEVVHSRVERFSPGCEFSTITARAFGSLAAFAEAVRHVAGAGTRLLAMKGKRPRQELDGLPVWVSVEAVHRLHVPGLDAERHLVLMSVTA